MNLSDLSAALSAWGDESNVLVGLKEVCTGECDRNEAEVPDGGDIEHTGLERTYKVFFTHTHTHTPNYWESVNIVR